MIEISQKHLDKTNSKNRKHYIPKMVNKFARFEQMSGKYDDDPPTLPDIYVSLAKEGLKILKDKPEIKVVFREVKKPAGAKSTLIKIQKKRFKKDADQLNEQLQALDKAIQKGEYEFERPSDVKGRVTGSISLISIAVVLMELALTEGEFSETYKALLSTEEK